VAVGAVALATLVAGVEAHADEASPPAAAAPASTPAHADAAPDNPAPKGRGPRRWEAQRLPWYAPPTIPYLEGVPFPPGYWPALRPRRSFIAAGAALFGGSYLASVLTAATILGGNGKHSIEVAPLFAPFAGPFATLGTSRDVQLNDPGVRTNGVLVIVDGVAQVAGAALFIAGYAAPERVLVRTKESYQPEEAAWVPEVAFTGRGGALSWVF